MLIETKVLTFHAAPSDSDAGDSSAPLPSNTCVLGDPRGVCHMIEGFSQAGITSHKNWTSSAQTLALSLLSLFFTQEEQAVGVYTPQGGGTASKGSAKW